MTLLQLLSELAQHGIALNVTTDAIHTNVTPDKIPGHLKDVLKLNKQTLIDLFYMPLRTDETDERLLKDALAGGSIVVDKNGAEIDDPSEWLTNLELGLIKPGDEVPF